jgi:hypothetical protein
MDTNSDAKKERQGGRRDRFAELAVNHGFRRRLRIIRSQALRKPARLTRQGNGYQAATASHNTGSPVLDTIAPASRCVGFRTAVTVMTIFDPAKFRWGCDLCSPATANLQCR